MVRRSRHLTAISLLPCWLFGKAGILLAIILHALTETAVESRRQSAVAMVLIVSGLTTIVLFCFKAGMSLWVVVVFFTFYFSYRRT